MELSGSFQLQAVIAVASADPPPMINLLYFSLIIPHPHLTAGLRFLSVNCLPRTESDGPALWLWMMTVCFRPN